MGTIFKIILVVSFVALVSCNTDPVIEDAMENKIESSNDLKLMVNGAYADMGNRDYMGREYIIIGEVMSDNAYSRGTSNRFESMSAMDVKYVMSDTQDHNGYVYRRTNSSIGKANIIINSDLEQVEDLDANKDDVNHILGEAYAIRAMAHFDLLRFYGQQNIDEGENLGVPYIKEYKGEDLNVPRGTIESNKKDIYADIEKAIELLTSAQGSQYESSKIVFTLNAVYALQSRVGVYFGGKEDYKKAREAAKLLIGQYSLTPASEYVDYWKADTPGAESIFELAHSAIDKVEDGGMGQLWRGTVYGDINTFKNIRQDVGFDDHDVRGTEEMIGTDPVSGQYTNLGKYTLQGGELATENIKVFRYAEVLLNYAEALLDTDTAEALTYLNQVATARNAATYSVANLDNILKERRKEFIYEGFRFHDLARTGRDIRSIDNSTPNNHGLVKAGSHRFALPIPRHELDSNDAMVQNPGYAGR